MHSIIDKSEELNKIREANPPIQPFKKTVAERKDRKNLVIAHKLLTFADDNCPMV